MSGFWVGGMSAYLNALKAEHTRRISALKQELKKVSSADEAREIQGQIKQEQAEHRGRVRHAKKSLF
jgi:hypothetical protein